MILALIQALRDQGIEIGVFRLADFITVRALLGMATALGFSVLVGHRVIASLYRRGIRDTSGEFVSIEVSSKRGTPTAGGVLVLLATTVAAGLWGDLKSPFLGLLMTGFLYLGLVGFIDDLLKVRFKSSLVGLSQLGKTAFLLAFAIPCSALLVSSLSPLPSSLRTLLQAPFYKYPLVDLGTGVFFLFAVFAIFAIVNAVNITDGMDGLLGGTATLTLGVYVVFAYVMGNSALSAYLLFPMIPGADEIAVFGSILSGAILGFLWFNAYPAQVFMGDSGSLAIGGAIAMMAFLVKQELLFLIVGGVFVLEILTSLIQDKVGSRLGRRLVYRAPFHYSVQHRGIAEPKVVVRLGIVALILALVGLLSLKVR